MKECVSFVEKMEVKTHWIYIMSLVAHTAKNPRNTAWWFTFATMTAISLGRMLYTITQTLPYTSTNGASARPCWSRAGVPTILYESSAKIIYEGERKNET